MYFGYLNLQNVPRIAYCVTSIRQLNSKGGRQVKITLLTPTLVIFLCRDVFNITRPK